MAKEWLIIVFKCKEMKDIEMYVELDQYWY